MIYNIDFRPDEAETLWNTVLGWVPQNSRVLDVGTGSGEPACYLREQKQCSLFGVDLSEATTKIAASSYSDYVQGNVEEEETRLALAQNAPFDCVIMSNILEHLKEPELILRWAISVLSPQGACIVALPNIAHRSVRMSLLIGRFDYVDYGILDRTHLRFFTRKTMREMFGQCGYVIDQERGLAALPRKLGIFRKLLLRAFGTILCSQFLFRIVPNGNPIHEP